MKDTLKSSMGGGKVIVDGMGAFVKVPHDLSKGCMWVPTNLLVKYSM